MSGGATRTGRPRNRQISAAGLRGAARGRAPTRRSRPSGDPVR